MNALSSTFLSTLSQHPKSFLSCNNNNYYYSRNTSSFTLKVFSIGGEESFPSPPKREQIPSRKPSLPSNIFNAFDDFVNIYIDPPRKYYVDPKYVLSNNFAPIDELPPTECEVVEGSLPSCLDGAYIRNGPNPQYLPRGPYHLFDGDGMLHSIKISHGKATFYSRFVKTYKYNIENEAGFQIIPNVFSGFNGIIPSVTRGAITLARIIARQFNPANGIGLANTSLFGGKLFALGESDLPYAVKIASDGDIVTLGRHNFNGELVWSMTAHPKIDPDTNEAFAYRYGPFPPFLIYFRVNPNGIKTADVPIFSIKRPTLFHDIAITKKYAIFSDIQIGMNPIKFILAGGSLVGMNSMKISRLGVIPRYAKGESEMRWFDVPGFNNLHAINAWEEDGGDTIVLIAPNILSVEHTLERMDMIHGCVEKVKINLNSGVVSRHPISTRNLDFGVINPTYVGKKNKYVYAAIGYPPPKLSGIVKLDVSIAEVDRRDCIVACRMFGESCFCGEPFFVAKNNLEANEDDGYVMLYVHNEKTEESNFLVMDATSPSLDIVANVKLPRRVPYGFHGIFVRESDLNML
ncbi:probable carotenoid cleavage dioxygenase 4, chloroplastic [Solanum pennellii]|uniref:Probable carotenoid cleavage dioxygenase 4, chloroplastic n=1 Tax=Solanum pennellii TaxID=28526 RepID=A0ABM1HEF9_SOLPN|nr:probable carotenoid cleavage dioxygenase 4, chloroplastic [Solanum pennellii]